MTVEDAIRRALALTDEDQEGFEDSSAPDAFWRADAPETEAYDMADHSPATSRYREAEADGS